MHLYLDRKRFIAIIKMIPKNGNLLSIINKTTLHMIDFRLSDINVGNEDMCCKFFNIEKQDFQNYRSIISNLKANFTDKIIERDQCDDTRSKLEFYSSIFFAEKSKRNSTFGNGVIVKENKDKLISTLESLWAKTTHESFDSPTRIAYTRIKLDSNKEKKNIESWKKLITPTFPSTDIIIVDPYLFSDEDKKDNVESIIELLIQKNEHANIVIFCLNKLYKDSCNDVLVDLQDKFKESRITIVCILQFDYNEKKSLHMGLHDRYIITNYRLYISGHSFNKYYDSEGAIIANGGIWFCECSAIENNFSFIVSKIIDEQLQPIIDRCSNNEIFGSKTSELLDFSKSSQQS